RIQRNQPQIVGFTSVFQQHTASLALAKRLKATNPNVTIVFGGANCEGVMGHELLRQFAFVDAVASGEADIAFPALARSILRHPWGTITEIPGIRWNSRLSAVGQNSPSSTAYESKLLQLRPPTAHKTPINSDRASEVVDLNDLPFPDFADYIQQLS